MDTLSTLVKSAQSGNLEAFEKIVKLFQDMAYAIAYSMLNDAQLAEDVAQEAFIEAYLELSKLREPAAFPGWFRRIVFKQSDRSTRGKHISTIPLEHGFDISTADFSLATLIEERERDKLVRNAIEELSDNERIVILLFYSTGYALKDIATFLEVPITTIKKRLHDAKSHLKESLIETARDYLREQRQRSLDHFSEKVHLLIAIRMAIFGRVKTILNQNPWLVNANVERNGCQTQSYTWIGNGLNPLYEAARNGNQTMVNLLLGYGAILQTGTYNALTIATQFNHADTVKLLLKHGAEPNGRPQSGFNVKDVNLGPSPLRIAAMKGHQEIVKLLLEQGAIVNAFGQTGRTALHWAALKGKRDIVKMLLDFGADCSVQDELGRTPLGWALIRKHQEIAKQLQDHMISDHGQVT